jgi:3-methylcrotonyl-CoA carboxylase alpha subunit/acetyl-CoA/propionyl-CoA carboxylase biotin carboxyl carrier protein
VTDGERRFAVHAVASGKDALRLEIDGALHEFFVQRSAHAVTVGHHGHAHVFRRPEQFLHDATAAAGDGTVTAPMPGTILAVNGSAGQDVRAGHTVVVMEAMKMELALQAPLDGQLAAVHVTAGSQVGLGDKLFEVTPDGQSA